MKNNVALSPHPTTEAPQAPARDRKTLVELMSCIILAGFVMAVAFHYIVANQGGDILTDVQVSRSDGRAPRTLPMIYVGRQYPANTFLFRPWDSFNDFAGIYQLFQNPEWMQSQPFRWNHFPFAFVALLPYYFLFPPSLGIVIREIVIVLPFLAIAATQLKGDSRYGTFRNVLIFSACTYPFLFAVDRANNEADIFLLLCWFVFLLRDGDYTRSVVPLALALAFKPYAGALLPLLVIEKMSFRSLLDSLRASGPLGCVSTLLKGCREAIAAPLLALLLNLVSLPILWGLFSYTPSVLPRAWQQTVDAYVVGDAGLPFNNSLWGPLKIILYGIDPGSYLETVRGAMSPYRTFVLVAFLLICLYAWIFEHAMWKRVALFVFSMNLFPYVSADYKLLHVFIPMWLFLNDREGDTLDRVYAVLFALLLVPKNYALFANPGDGEANLGIVVNPMLMLAMVAIIVGSGLSRVAADRVPAASLQNSSSGA